MAGTSIMQSPVRRDFCGPKDLGRAARVPTPSRKPGRPGVTVVIPAYNMQDFLGRALGSALGQTYPNLEIIVVDDGSTDGTRAIAERCADREERVRVVSIGNGGIAAARNLGTRMAATPYVAYLDADDLWHPEKIARQVAALAAHGHQGEWAGCYTLSRFIGLEDQVLANDTSAEARGDFFDRHVYRNHVGNGSSLLVRRDAALDVGGFRQGEVEDYDFQLKFLLSYKLELVREFLVGYRVYPGQRSDDRVRLSRARIATLQGILPSSKLNAKQRARVLVHARLTAAFRELRAGHWSSAVARIGGSILRAPRTNLELIAELVALHVRKRRGLRDGPPGRCTPERPRVFSDFPPTEGVAPADDVNERPRARLAALRDRSAGQAPDEEAPADRIASGQPAHSAW